MADGNGVAGASARRQHERRKAKDEARIREQWGRFGNIAVALTPERQSTRAWSTGALGEELVGARLDRIASERIRVLHDRRIPGSKGNIDHIVVTPVGVWVVDTKRYKGTPSLRVEGGLFRPRVERLFVGGRDHTKLVGGVLGQIQRVLEVVPNAPVRGVLCFVDADWPLMAAPFKVGGVEVLWPRKLVALLTATGPERVDVEEVAKRIEARFRSA
ncbi:MAG: NERD domain-containing protein [Homoserinimonas sp.]|nr:NERD domain-containing protein [Homoserinimonas sp.]